MQSQLKRNRIIDELKKHDVTEIDGQDLSAVKYSTLLRKLTVIRAGK